MEKVADESPSTRTLDSEEKTSSSDGTYFLILEGRSWRRHDLTGYGDSYIGRDSRAQICIRHWSVSRQHARCTVTESAVILADENSHNGTSVNGDRLQGPRSLISGDLVNIGKAHLVFHRESKASRARALGNIAGLYLRVEQELARARELDHSFTVACVSLSSSSSTPSDSLRVSEAIAGLLRPRDYGAWRTERQMFLLIPELDGDAVQRCIAEVLRVLSSLGWEGKFGLAVYPLGGQDRDTLLNHAEQAAQYATEAAASDTNHVVQIHEFGSQRVLIADASMHKLYKTIRSLAETDLTVLISGETGTGKELVAAALHYWSPRGKKGRFIAQNCASIPETLMDDALLGHERGAFTDAKDARLGLFESADGGTLFLDEISELSPRAQAKLLRILDRKEVARLGTHRAPIPVDVRVIAATNVDLLAAISDGRFRRDLYQRLAPPYICLKPLRERPLDIPLLAREFLRAECLHRMIPEKSISEDSLKRFLRYRWPGNVRELRRVIEDLVARVNEPILEVWHLDPYLCGEPVQSTESLESTAVSVAASTVLAAPAEEPMPAFRRVNDEVMELERRRMTEALRASNNIVSRAARLINMPERTFYKRMKEYGLVNQK